MEAQPDPTHVSQPEGPDGPFGGLGLGQHLHADLAVHDGFIGEGPVVITLDLRPQEHVRTARARGGGESWEDSPCGARYTESA